MATNRREHWAELNRRIESCEACPRLVLHCRNVASAKRAAYREQVYWGKPVPNFGDVRGRLLIVGLAPGAHGSNRTGRMFTGDTSGDWLYRAMHRAGFASQPSATDRDDERKLIDCAITAVGHCAPPDNKLTREEIESCRPWLVETIEGLSELRVLLALGGIAWTETVREARRRGWVDGAAPKFSHGATAKLGGQRWLLGSYHPSRQNTNTGRLTEAMLDEAFATARRLVDS